MRSLFAAALLFAAVFVGAPAEAVAQEAEAKPAAKAPAAAQQRPAKESAVPRSEIRVREPESESRGREKNVVAEESRRVRVPVNASSESNASNDDQDRRGAVRRPPAGGSADGRSSGSGKEGSTAGRGEGSRTTGRAVPRSEAPRPRVPERVYVYPDYYRYYNRYYDPWGYGSFGLGYFYYSPWGWNPGYNSYYGYGAPRYSAYGYDLGSVKLKVKPRDAEVYVDGYFAGHVDDFDGIMQSLKLDSGGYRIEIRKPGFAPLQFDVRVQPERTITFRGELKPAP